jgi:hypothetical protein
MIRIEGGVFLLMLALDVFCVIDLIQTREDEVRNLPKIAWLLLILIFTPIGSIAWLVAGRPERGRSGRSPYERTAPAYPEYDRPGRAAGLTEESDEEFLRRVRERAEEQRRIAAEQRRERERAEEAEREARKRPREDGDPAGGTT